MKTNNWKKEYSTTFQRKGGSRNYKIISTDPLKYFGQTIGTIFTPDIKKSILSTGYDLSKIKIIDENNNKIII